MLGMYICKNGSWGKQAGCCNSLDVTNAVLEKEMPDAATFGAVHFKHADGGRVMS